MPQVRIDALVSFQCRDDQGRLLPWQTEPVSFEMEELPGVEPDYSSYVLAQARSIEPPGCVAKRIEDISVVEIGGGEGGGDGGLISIRAYFWMVCSTPEGTEERRPLEFVGNFPPDTTLDVVLSEIYSWGVQEMDTLVDPGGYFEGDYTVCGAESIELLESPWGEMSTGI